MLALIVGEKMIKLILFLGYLLGSTAMASNERCSATGLREAYNSMDVRGVKACFVYTKAGV